MLFSFVDELLSGDLLLSFRACVEVVVSWVRFEVQVTGQSGTEFLLLLCGNSNRKVAQI